MLADADMYNHPTNKLISSKRTASFASNLDFKGKLYVLTKKRYV